MAGQQTLSFLDDNPCSRVNATVHRTSRTGEAEDFKCPPCVPDYQKYMGVDLADQRISYFQVGHKTNKWTRRMFFFK